jgi:hypothetical protein
MTRPPVSPAVSPAVSRRRQSGLTLVSLIILGVILVFGTLLVMKVFPTVTEYLAIKRAVVKARSDGGDPASIRSSFGRATAIDDIMSITPNDLLITRTASGEYAVAFAYEKRIPLFGPVWLLLDYRGEAQPQAAVGR